MHSAPTAEAVSRMLVRSYRELIRLPTFSERFEYLRLAGIVGKATFGGHRIIGQEFYTSKLWKSIRDQVIVRDNACNLAHPDYPIVDRVYVHHINPITIDDFLVYSDRLIDLDNLICMSYETHNALHYGVEQSVPKQFTERRQNDTCPWK